MRTWIGIAIVVAIGLIWSVAAMLEWAVSPHVITAKQGESASAE